MSSKVSSGVLISAAVWLCAQGAPYAQVMIFLDDDDDDDNDNDNDDV